MVKIRELLPGAIREAVYKTKGEMKMREGRSNQGPAKEDTPPDSGFNPKQTREQINRRNSDSMRRDYEETPDDFVMPEPPPGRNPTAPTRTT